MNPIVLRHKIRGLERLIRRDEPRPDISRRQIVSLHRRYHTLYRKFKETPRDADHNPLTRKETRRHAKRATR